MDCSLCESVEKEAYRVIATSDYAVAMIIREPQVEGHSLVLPKRHVERFADLEPDESYALHDMVEALTSQMQEVLGVPALTLINGAPYQTQPHIHYQVIPLDAGVRTVISAYGDMPERTEVPRAKLAMMAMKLM